MPREARDDDDVAAIFEARDILFAKLLQYRAFKKVALEIAQYMSAQSLSFPRNVPLEEAFHNILPDVDVPIGCVDLAILAAGALFRRPDQVAINHIHDPLVPVESQISVLRQRLMVGDRMSFAQLCSDAVNVATVVSRFWRCWKCCVRVKSILIKPVLESLIVIRVKPGNTVALESNDRSDAERSL